MPVFNSRARCACAAAVLAVVSVNQTAKADQIFWTGNGETGNWDDPANWAEIGQGALPGSTQDAINNTGEQINYQSVDSYSVNSFTTNGLFVMAGGTFSGSQPGISTLEVDNGMEMFGGTLRGFVINSSGPGVSINNSTSNFFDNVTSNTSLDLSLSGALQVNNGLTLGSSAVVGVGGGGFLSFDNTESLSGGAVAFGLGTNYLSVEGNSTLTINGTFIHGGNGVIGYQRYVGGSNAIINNGTISADVSGDTITLIGSSFANTGTLSAANGGELLLNTSIDNTGGNIDVGSGSTVLVNGVSVTGGTINGPGSLTFINSNSNILTGVTSNANFDLTNGTRVQIENGLSLNSANSINLDNNAFLIFSNTQNFDTGTVNFGSNSTQYLTVEGASVLTLGTGATVQGATGIIGYQTLFGGVNTVTNNGLISANTAGDTITIQPSILNNTGTIQAISGGKLSFSIGSSTNSGTIAVDAASSAQITTNGTGLDNTGGDISIAGTFTLNTATISNGSISGTGSLTAINSASNVLTNVSESAPIDLSNGGRILLNGSTLAANANLDNTGVLLTEGATTFLSGMTTFGGDSTQYISVEGDSTLTINGMATIHGTRGVLGYQFLAGGSNTINNHGTISADVSGGTITVQPTSFSNDGTVQAINGGEINFTAPNSTNTGTFSASGTGSVLSLNTTMDNTGGTISSSSSGTILLNNVSISQGDISGTGSLTAIDSASNILTNVSESAPISLTTGGRILLNSSTLTANANLDNTGVLYIEGSSTFASGTTTLGGDSTQYISVEGGSTLTIDGAAIIHGTTGILGYEFLVSGTNTINNFGTISADVAGGTITIQPTIFSNVGTVKAINGGEINFIAPNSTNAGTLSASGTGSVISLNTTMDNTGGTISASSSGTILLSNVSITNGAISGSGTLTAIDSNSNILNNVSESASINLTNGGRIILNGSSLAANASLDNAAILFVEGTSTFVSGTTTLGGDSTQNVAIEGNSSLTIDAPAIIHGTNGVIGNAFLINGPSTLINHGTISADVAGGALTILPTTFSNDGTVQAVGGGTLNLNTNVANTGGIIHAGSGATVEFNSITVTGGTLTGPGDLLFTNANANTLDNVTVNGNLDLTGPGRVQLLDNLALTGNINVANGGFLFISNTQTLSTGNIDLQGNANIGIEGATTFTLGSAASVVASSTGNSIGNQYLVNGASSLINHGFISTLGSGATLSLSSTTPITNTGFITAGTGTTITDNAAITNTGGKIAANVGGTYIFNGVTVTGGTISGPGDLFLINSNSNVLDGVTVNGTLDMTGPGRAQLTDGLNLTGSVNMDNGAILFAISSQTITGGTINFGADGTQNLSIEGASILTLSSSTVIHGTNGTIGNQFSASGANGLINHGTIDANVSGGAFSILAPLTNTGTVHAAANASMAMSQGETQTAGSTTADGTITISAGGLALSGGTVSGNGTLSVTGPMTWSGGNVTGNGLLQANSGLSISNSVTRSGQGLIMVNNGFSMAPGASLDLTQSDLVINYTSTGISPIGTIATALAAGYNHGPWNGVGIKSSNGTLAAGTSLGYGDNTVLGYSTFDFQPVATDSVIVKYTWLGDTNLDGKVTNADLTMLNAGAAGHLSGWTNGDFNYDGTINADDYSLFMLGDAKQTGTLGPTVPEPAMIGIALVPLLMRRRGRR